MQCVNFEFTRVSMSLLPAVNGCRVFKRDSFHHLQVFRLKQELAYTHLVELMSVSSRHCAFDQTFHHCANASFGVVAVNQSMRYPPVGIASHRAGLSFVNRCDTASRTTDSSASLLDKHSFQILPTIAADTIFHTDSLDSSSQHPGAGSACCHQTWL